MRIQQIRNATLKIEYGDVTFLIDPWLQDKPYVFLTLTCVRKNVQLPDRSCTFISCYSKGQL